MLTNFACRSQHTVMNQENDSESSEDMSHDRNEHHSISQPSKINGRIFTSKTDFDTKYIEYSYDKTHFNSLFDYD